MLTCTEELWIGIFTCSEPQNGAGLSCKQIKFFGGGFYFISLNFLIFATFASGITLKK